MPGTHTIGRVEVADRIVPRRGLSRRMRAASFALAETLFTTDEGPPPKPRLDWLLDELDHFIAHAGARAKLVYRLCLFAVSTVAPLMVLRLLPLRMLSPDTRRRAVERFDRSLFGLALFGVKALLAIIYYEHPEVAVLIGHDGACLSESSGGAEA